MVHCFQASNAPGNESERLRPSAAAVQLGSDNDSFGTVITLKHSLATGQCIRCEKKRSWEAWDGDEWSASSQNGIDPF